MCEISTEAMFIALQDTLYDDFNGMPVKVDETVKNYFRNHRAMLVYKASLGEITYEQLDDLFADLDYIVEPDEEYNEKC